MGITGEKVKKIIPIALSGTPRKNISSICIVELTITHTDNYEECDEPMEIVNLLAKNIPAYELNKSVYKVIDRFSAMKQALSKAKLLKGRTLIVSTGVGNEFGLTRPGGKIEWNEKQKWKEVFSMLGKER